MQGQKVVVRLSVVGSGRIVDAKGNECRKDQVEKSRLEKLIYSTNPCSSVPEMVSHSVCHCT
jgi:hypothetical protein